MFLVTPRKNRNSFPLFLNGLSVMKIVLDQTKWERQIYAPQTGKLNYFKMACVVKIKLGFKDCFFS